MAGNLENAVYVDQQDFETGQWDNPSDWEFLNEGNANLIIKYCGNRSDLKSKVLRMAKNSTQNQQISLDFQAIVVSELLGNGFYSKSEQVDLPLAFIQQVTSSVARLRHEDRVVGELVLSQQAILMDNLADSKHGISAEIKPKWGFKPPNYTKCRFCLHNSLKSASKPSHKSHFCPLELYSNNQEQVLASLKSICVNPMNNLRFFNDSRMLSMQSIPADQLDFYLQILTDILIKSPLLSRLRQQQEQFHDEVLDLDNFKEHGKNLDNEQYLKQVIRDQWPSEAFIKGNPAYYERRISRYLLSNSLKDLSVFVTIEGQSEVSLVDCVDIDFDLVMENDSQGSIKFRNGHQFHYSIKAVDVDIKRLESLSKWVKLEQEILQSMEPTAN